MRVLKKWIFAPQIDRQTCIFCKFNFQNVEPIHYQDDKYYVITDIQKASAIQHLLVIPKEHLDNALKVDDPDMILEMQKIGQKILGQICQRKGIEKKFRFGFHLPPINSIDHLHLHCFIQPLESFKYDKIHYGYLLNSVEDVLKKIKKTNQ